MAKYSAEMKYVEPAAVGNNLIRLVLGDCDELVCCKEDDRGVVYEGRLVTGGGAARKVVLSFAAKLPKAGVIVLLPKA